MGSLGTYFLDVVYSFTNCMVCFPSSPQLKINSRSFKILRLLGEGGFSYVYLVQDNANQQLLALKKIRCPFGQESVSLALKEVEAYTLFAPHPNIIHSIDYAVEKDKSDSSANTVYILLPYYRRGNLQDMINANLVNHAKFPERRLMVLFLGVCKALKAMHQYKVKGGPGGAKSEAKAKGVRKAGAKADAHAAESMEMRPNRRHRENDDDSEQEAEPLMEGEITMEAEGIAPGGARAYAHRDIKPGNIMIDDDGTTPILMDLGSLAASPTPITSRSLALQVQDLAAEHSTMPYRAPELFDVKTDSVIDTKVDIWSLGCTLYACLVGKSPFEARSDETGGSLSICVLGGDWRFPDEGPQRGKQKQPAAEEAISDGVKEVVRQCLRLEPGDRPDVDQLISLVERVLRDLPEDGADG
ncbi:kinase-like protein [Dothidotthia symphoricarpi CBS 119687]|uniref:non-specific serine/threonine protein kinase n=1 Tax=Dothidotthia symphoricarpi CBS 119687 TaxID=1392245 RepID=A0A6A6AQ68_9PLEO|nr:kinase-like protein [Dothidotthia symphoricarpi CBS 119687]KAF2132661.1 kinase-like protein [Dothidotthia symphoricarpi CBS 119687]